MRLNSLIFIFVTFACQWYKDGLSLQMVMYKQLGHEVMVKM